MRSASRNLDRGRSLARVSPWETIIGRANHSSNPPPPPYSRAGFNRPVLAVHGGRSVCEPCRDL